MQPGTASKGRRHIRPLSGVECRARVSDMPARWRSTLPLRSVDQWLNAQLVRCTRRSIIPLAITVGTTH